MMIAVHGVPYDLPQGLVTKIEAAIARAVKDVVDTWPQFALEHDYNRLAAKNIIRAYLDEIR